MVEQRTSFDSEVSHKLDAIQKEKQKIQSMSKGDFVIF